jgi:Icc-related predicted phosphoesterase
MLNNEFIGCKNLYETVLKKKPKLFICGHIHESRGEQKIKGTHFVNASSVDRFKTQLFPAFEIEIQTAKEAL